MKKILFVILPIVLIAILTVLCLNWDNFFEDLGAETNQTEIKKNNLIDEVADDLPEIPTNNTSDTTKEETEPEYIAVSDFTLSFSHVSLTVGERVMPIVTVHPQDATNKEEIWMSSDSLVATVDNLGNIVAVGEGMCTVTVASVDNENVFKSVDVEVSADIECTYIDGFLIVNKTYPLPKSYAPGWETEASPHLWEMIRDAETEGIKLWMTSGYRSWYDQQYIYNGYVARDGQEAADKYSARPGHSEHQTGLAYDLNDLSHDFGETPEGIWVAENCHKYGFIIRYPENKEHITGYIYEPWHIRYLGVEKATEIFESGLCVEEFFGICSEYSQ